MSLWSKMSLLKEKYKWVIQTLIYVITFQCSLLLSLLLDICLENVTQDRWLEVLTTSSSSLLIELRVVWIKDYGGSWIKRISNSFLFSKITLVSVLFFQTFCENNQRFFKIISLSYLQLSKLICFYFHKAPDTFLYATPY